ncbi:hypothetical protein B0H14DRAFT_2650931, partial [Mycena olivaceomarginata]
FPSALPPPELPVDQNDPFYEYTEPRPERKRLFPLEPGGWRLWCPTGTRSFGHSTMRKKWRVSDSSKRTTSPPSRHESRANDYRRNLPIICACQVEVLVSYQADHERIIDALSAKRTPSGSTRTSCEARTASIWQWSGGLLSCRAASGEPVPLIAVPSKRGLAEIDDVELPPIAAISEGDTDSGEERPPEVSRTGAPSKERRKRQLDVGSRASGGFRCEHAKGARRPLEGSSSTQQETPKFDVDAWHEAHNPFTQRPFQQDLVLNANGTKAVVSHGWELDPVNPRFLARLAPYGVLASQMPSWAVTSRAKIAYPLFRLPGVQGMPQQRGRLRSPRSVGAPPVKLPAVPHEKPDLHRANLRIRLYGDRPRYFHHERRARRHVRRRNPVVPTPLTGVDVAARIMSRVIVYRQDTRLREDALLARIRQRLGRPWSVLSTFSFAREPDTSSSSSGPSFLSKACNTATASIGSLFPSSRTRATQRRSLRTFSRTSSNIFPGGSGHGGLVRTARLASLPSRRRVEPGGFEAGDRPLDLAGSSRWRRSTTSMHPPILPPTLNCSISLRRTTSVASALVWRRSIRDVSYRHADGRVTGPLVAGGFDTSEDDSAREDDSTRADDTAARRPLGPPSSHRRGIARYDASHVFRDVHVGPDHALEFFADVASLGSTGILGGPRFAAASFETTPTPQAGGSLFVGSSVDRFSALDMTPLVPSTVRRVGYTRDVAPPRIVIDTYIARASSPGRGPRQRRERRFLERARDGNANGASVGSIESGGAVAGSSAGAGVEDVDME